MNLFEFAKGTPLGLWSIPVFILIITFGVVLLVWRKGLNQRVWIISISFSLFCLISIVVVWLGIVNIPLKCDNGFAITSPAELEDFLSTYKQPITEHHPLFIPTGVFIQSLEFVSSNDIQVTGFIWQKYRDDLPSDLKRGFIFPEGSDTETNLDYQIHQGDTEVMGWYFKTTLRQRFFFNHFPLDTQDVWLRIWDQDIQYNVFLTPDIEAYDTLDPEQLPGLDSHFVLENWYIQTAYYSYLLNAYNTDFGIKDNKLYGNFPELYYNLGIRRNTLNALLIYVTPPLITAVMIFGMLVISTHYQEKKSYRGWDPASAIWFCADLLLVIVFTQTNMRVALNSPEVVYLEYFYFIIYGGIIFVTINSLLFSKSEKFWFIHFSENLYTKSLYWPLVTASFLVITLLTFA